MANERSSPYKEVGMSANARCRPRRGRLPPVGVSPGEMKRRRSGHVWGLAPAQTFRRTQKTVAPGTNACARCGRPRFAVDGLPCEGKR